jgi:hypothetical protein
MLGLRRPSTGGVVLMNKRLPVITAYLAACVVESPALAYRPFDSTDAAVARRGEFELELGPVEYQRVGSRKALLAPSIVANLGVFTGWEAVLQGRERFPFASEPGENRVQLVDTGAFLKGVIRAGSLQSASGPSIGTELGVLLPTVNDEPGAGVSGSLILSQRWAVGTVHLNAEGARTRSGHPDAFFGTILEGPYEWRVRPVAEAFYEREFNVERTFSGLIGLIGRVSDPLSLDAGARAARVQDTNLFEVRAGLTWAFTVWGGGEE